MTVAITDIETALGRTLSDSEQAQANQWIEDARTLIGIRLGDLAALNEAAVDLVTRYVVVAQFRNPGGYSSETIDDYTYRLPGETRRVTILPEWWDLLTPNTGAFSISPAYVADDPATMAAWYEANT